MRLTRRLAIAATVLAGAAAPSAVLANANGAAPAHPRTFTEARILRIAHALAAGGGDATPMLIEHAYGTREQLNRADSGDIVPGSERSILIVVFGHFVDTRASYTGASPPAGIEMSVIEDVARGRVTDAGIGPHYPDLRRLSGARVDYVDRSQIAVVTGAIRRPGAPAARLGGTVTLFSPAGYEVDTASVRAGHDFRLRLVPGRYRIVAGGRLHTVGACAPVRIHPRAAQTLRIDLETGCAGP